MNCEKSTSVCLVGENLDYVLFTLAIEAASKGRNVWFISVKPFEKVPSEIQSPCKQVLQLITFIYLRDFPELIKHLNGIHKWKQLPTVILLKNFDLYCNLQEPDYKCKGTAFLVATLLNSMSFLCKKQHCKTLLVLSCSRGTLNEAVLVERLKVFSDMYFDFFFPPLGDPEMLLEEIRALNLLH